MANLQEVEQLLRERYNVTTLDGPLKAAIDAGDVGALKALIAERDMYRWTEPLTVALNAKANAPAETEPIEPAEPVTATEPEAVELEADPAPLKNQRKG